MLVKFEVRIFNHVLATIFIYYENRTRSTQETKKEKKCNPTNLGVMCPWPRSFSQILSGLFRTVPGNKQIKWKSIF